jgi:hypothetical protein
MDGQKWTTPLKGLSFVRPVRTPGQSLASYDPHQRRPAANEAVGDQGLVRALKGFPESVSFGALGYSGLLGIGSPLIDGDSFCAGRDMVRRRRDGAAFADGLMQSAQGDLGALG